MEALRQAYVESDPTGPTPEVSAELRQEVLEAERLLAEAQGDDIRESTQGPRPDYTSWARWPDAKKGPNHIGIHFDVIDGEPLCVGVELWSRNPPPPDKRHRSPFLHQEDRAETIDTTLWRSIPIGRLLRESRARHEAFAHRLADPTSRVADGLAAVYPEGKPASSIRADGRRMLRHWQGRRRYPPEHFAEVARVYQSSVEGGRPTLSVAETFGVEKSTAAKWVARARNLGYLEPTTKGRAR